MTLNLHNCDQRTQLRNQLGCELFNDVIPFWLDHGLDREFGGIITALDREGTVVDEDKSIWAQGRFAWIMGKLCELFEPRESWRQAGLSAIGFLDQFGFDPDDGRMWFHVTREGKPIRKRRYSFSEAFAAIAYGQWAQINADDQMARQARQCFERFRTHRPTAKFANTRPTKNIGQPMITLATAQELRKSIELPDANSIIDRCINEIRDDFCKPDLRCVMETVSLDGQPLDHFDGRTLNPGHAIEAGWFIMREGEQRRDESLVRLGCDMVEWMWQRGWDAEHGGILYFVPLDGRPVQEYWHDMKFWWPHNEAIIATLLAWRLTAEAVWADRFNQVFEWTMTRFPDPRFGEWFGYLHRDGSISSTLKGNLWKGPFHIPRMYLECLRILA